MGGAVCSCRGRRTPTKFDQINGRRSTRWEPGPSDGDLPVDSPKPTAPFPSQNDEEDSEDPPHPASRQAALQSSHACCSPKTQPPHRWSCAGNSEHQHSFTAEENGDARIGDYWASRRHRSAKSRGVQQALYLILRTCEHTCPSHGCTLWLGNT